MATTAYTAQPGDRPVAEHVATWHDARRDRDVPVRVYRPDGEGAPCPVVVFSHGVGSSRDGYRYLGWHWASHGYVVVHVTHYGSDATALRGRRGSPPVRLDDFLQDAQHRQDRPRDLSFALERLAEDAALQKYADMTRVAAAGHSYGAFTAQALVGLVFNVPGRRNVSCADPRVKAAIAMSPQSEGRFGLHGESWNRIDRPVLSVTGTRDIEYGVGSAVRRRTSFDRTPGRDQYLLTISGATHATFNDPPSLRVPVKPPDAAHRAYVLAATTAFLDAYVRDDPAARQWLSGAAPAQLWGDACELERKRVTPAARTRPR